MNRARESGSMNQVPQHVEHNGEERPTHDGLAAVAISLLFVALVVFMVSQLI
jgi:hypothetical protein